jgi:hypothetical protein
MRFLGWLKGKGLLMGGLIALCMLPLSGCPESKPDDTQKNEDVWDRADGIWDASSQPADAEEDQGPVPVYGVWEDVMPEVNPPQDVYGIWPNDVETDQGPVDMYGVDIGPPDVGTTPEVMGAYGIWDAVTPEEDPE